jgi:hypothetical protein
MAGSTKADVLAEIQAEAEAWRTWQQTVRQQAHQIKSAHGWCAWGMTELLGKVGVTYDRYNRDAEIPLETAAVNPDHYTAEGLRQLVLEPARAKHAQMKQELRQYALSSQNSGFVTSSELQEAFTALGLELPRDRTRIDVSNIYVSFFTDAAIGSISTSELQDRVLEAIAGAMPEGAEPAQEGTGNWDSNSLYPQAHVSAYTSRGL